jgi:molybdopterin converting factor subunit 1
MPALNRTYTHPVPEAASRSQICVNVRLFASYREAAGVARLEVPLPSGATVGDLLDLLSVRVPGLRTAPGMVAVNHVYVGSDFALHDGDEAALIPPVSGGHDGHLPRGVPPGVTRAPGRAQAGV